MICIVGVSNKLDQHAVRINSIGLGRLFGTGERDQHAAGLRGTVVDGHIVARIQIEAVEGELVGGRIGSGHHPGAVGVLLVRFRCRGAIRHITKAGSVTLVTLAIVRRDRLRREDVDERLSRIVKMHGTRDKVVDGVESVGRTAPTVVETEIVVLVITVQHISMTRLVSLRAPSIIDRSTVINLILEHRNILIHQGVQEVSSVVVGNSLIVLENGTKLLHSHISIGAGAVGRIVHLNSHAHVVG